MSDEELEEGNEVGLERMTTALMLREVLSEFADGFNGCVTVLMSGRKVMEQEEELTPGQSVRLTLQLLRKHGALLYATQSEGGASLTAYLRLNLVSIIEDVESLLRQDKSMPSLNQLSAADKIPAAAINKMLLNFESFIENSSEEEINDLNVFFKFVEAVDSLLSGFKDWLKFYLEDRQIISFEENVDLNPIIGILISLLEKYGVPFLQAKAAEQDGDVAYMFDNIDEIAIGAEVMYRQQSGLLPYSELPEEQKLWYGMQKVSLIQEEGESGTDEN